MTAPSDADDHVLRLYVAGETPRSRRAVINLTRICADELEGRYRLQVIDLYQQPELTAGEQIIAVPAVIRRLPRPPRTVIGDMSDTARVLAGLNLGPP